MTDATSIIQPLLAMVGIGVETDATPDSLRRLSASVEQLSGISGHASLCTFAQALRELAAEIETDTMTLTQLAIED